jgi:hypothetical protein
VYWHLYHRLCVFLSVTPRSPRLICFRLGENVPIADSRILPLALMTSGLAFAVLLILTYFKTTAPGSLAPDAAELHRLIFQAAKPVSALERRLAAADTPLGTGPLVTAGTTMESPFYGQSLTAAELSRRDGERRALLDWIRSGANRAAYDADDYALARPAEIEAVTPQFVHATSGAGDCKTQRVRIRAIINERCVSCHHEDGEDTARLLPFDSYEAIAIYLRPEDNADGARPWLLASLFSFLPLATIVGLTFLWFPSTAWGLSARSSASTGRKQSFADRRSQVELGAST